jgi:hypothetical protein
MLTVGDLGCFGCPVLLDFSNSGNGTCRNHDGEEVVAIDISGKVEESDKNNRKVTHKAASATRDAGVVLLHSAAMTAPAAEYVGGGCCCAFLFKLNMFKWGNCWFLIFFQWLLALIFSQWSLNWWSLVLAETE